MDDLNSYRKTFFEALIHQDMAQSMAVIESALQAGVPAKRILLNVVSAAMDQVGDLQANQEITLSEVFVMARISDSAIDRLLRVVHFRVSRPYSDNSEEISVIVGSAEGDYHSLGRKIVCSFLRMAGFQVTDLGVNVSAEKFVDRAEAQNAPVICVSALLLHTAENITKIRELLCERGLENRIKLVVGGAVFNFDRELYHMVGADATAVNAPGAVAVVRSLLGEKR